MHLPPPPPSLPLPVNDNMADLTVLDLFLRVFHLLVLLKSVKGLRCAVILQLPPKSPVLMASYIFILPAVFPVFSSRNPNNSTTNPSVIRQPCAIHMLLESYHSLNCPY